MFRLILEFNFSYNISLISCDNIIDVSFRLSSNCFNLFIFNSWHLSDNLLDSWFDTWYYLNNFFHCVGCYYFCSLFSDNSFKSDWLSVSLFWNGWWCNLLDFVGLSIGYNYWCYLFVYYFCNNFVIEFFSSYLYWFLFFYFWMVVSYLLNNILENDISLDMLIESSFCNDSRLTNLGDLFKLFKNLSWNWLFSYNFNVVGLFISDSHNYFTFSFWCFDNHSGFDAVSGIFGDSWDNLAIFRNGRAFNQLLYNILNDFRTFNDLDIIGRLNLWARYYIIRDLCLAWGLS